MKAISNVTEMHLHLQQCVITTLIPFRSIEHIKYAKLTCPDVQGRIATTVISVNRKKDTITPVQLLVTIIKKIQNY